MDDAADGVADSEPGVIPPTDGAPAERAEAVEPAAEPAPVYTPATAEQPAAAASPDSATAPPDPAQQARLYAEAARLADQAGNPEQALEAYQRAFAAQPELDTLADHSLLLVRIGRMDALVQLVQAARAVLSPQQTGMLVDRLGRHYLKDGNLTAGSALMQQLSSAMPDLAMPYNQLALMQAVGGNSGAALATVQRGLAEAGESYMGLYLQAHLTDQLSGPTAALPLARPVAAHPEADRNGYMLLLRLLEEQGNYDEEAQVARAGWEKFPGHPALLGYLAQALYFSGDAAGAVELLEDPATQAVDYPAREEILGAAYLDQGNYVKASAYLTTAAVRKPDSPQLLALLGQAQHFMGLPDEARGTLARALQLDPNTPGAHVWRGWVLLDAGDGAGAEEAWAAAERSPLASRDELAWTALGRAEAAVAAGDFATGRTQLGKAESFGVQTDAYFSKLAELRARVQ